jgi:hypothetical protein
MFGKVIKGGLLIKAVQVAQREARKPENREKINAALTKLKDRRGPAARP